LTRPGAHGTFPAMRGAIARFTCSATLLLGLPLLLGVAPPPPEDPVCSEVVIDVTIDPARGTLDETVSLVVAGRGASHLVFALDGGLGVKSSGASAGVIDHRQAGDALIVDLDPPLDGPRTLRFKIGGQPGRHAQTAIGPQRAILAPSTPWYPRLDGLWATTSVTIRVPPGWGSIAPGAPVPRTVPGVSKWTTGKPVRSIAVAAAPGLTVAAGSIVSTPLRLATSGAATPVKAVAARLAPAMAWLSGALAPYPFDSFNLAMLPGYDGRVDAGGLAIVGRAVPLATDSDGADVLAGQWWGQAVGGDGAWIEAFAAWEGCVFARDRALPLPADVEARRLGFFQLRSGDVPLASAPALAPPEVLRGKGSAAPDMIRLIAGDRAIFDAMREVFAAPIGRPLSLSALRALIEKHAGRSLEREFTEWFERTGAPQFEASVRSFPAAGGGFRADVTLTQKRGVYALPVDIVVYGPGGETRETIEAAEETTSVLYVVPFEPKRIEIDPLNRIFRWK
jgi:hypothetical protein